MTFRVEETKTGEPLELPVNRQLVAILQRRFAERDRFPERSRGWVFPSGTAESGHTPPTGPWSSFAPPPQRVAELKRWLTFVRHVRVY